MPYNLNSGYGQLEAIALHQNPLGGKTFLVCPSAHPNFQNLQSLFVSDLDGTVRFFTTLAAALAATTAARGDVIYIAEGYTDTITSATTLGLSVSGVTIIGLGYGSLRPTITYTTATSARIAVSAANITLKNIIFVANFGDIVTAFLLTTAQDFDVFDCEFRDTDSTHNFLTIITTTVAVVADGLKFNRNRLNIVGTTAATTPIKIAGTHNRVQINDNYIVKAVLNNTSCLLAHGALVVTNLEMARNRIFSANTDSASGGFLITTSSTTNSGMVYDNYVNGLDTAAAILVTAGSVYGMMNNLYDGDADASGFVLPAIGAN